MQENPENTEKGTGPQYSGQITMDEQFSILLADFREQLKRLDAGETEEERLRVAGELAAIQSQIASLVNLTLLDAVRRSWRNCVTGDAKRAIAASEVHQQIMMNLGKLLKSFRKDSLDSFRSMVRRDAGFRINRELKQYKNTQKKTQDIAGPDWHDQTASKIELKAEFDKELNAIIGQQTAAYQFVLYGRLRDRKSFEEMSKISGDPPATLRARWHRALKIIAPILRKRYSKPC